MLNLFKRSKKIKLENLKFPIYLTVYDQSYKIFNLEAVLIVGREKVVMKYKADWIISAILSDLQEEKNHVKTIYKAEFISRLESTFGDIREIATMK